MTNSTEENDGCDNITLDLDGVPIKDKLERKFSKTPLVISPKVAEFIEKRFGTDPYESDDYYVNEIGEYQ